MIERALSIRQPWAWAILHAGKDVENRRWKNYTRYLEREEGAHREVYIHASQRPGPTQMQRETEEFIAFCRERGIKLPDGAEPGKLTLRDLFRDCGGIVGAAKIIATRANGDSPSNPWAIAGCVGLVLADVRPLPFVECKGALGFWKVPADVQAKLSVRAA